MVQEARLVRQGTAVLQAVQVRQDLKEKGEIPVSPGPRAALVPKVPLVQLALEVLQAALAELVNQDLKVPADLAVQMDHQAQVDPVDPRESVDPEVKLDNQDLVGKLVRRVILEEVDQQVHLDLAENRERPVSLVHRDNLEIQDHQDPQDPLDPEDKVDPLDLQDRLVHQDQEDRQENQERLADRAKLDQLVRLLNDYI